MDFIIVLFIFHPSWLKPVLNNASFVAVKRQYRLGLCALLSENQRLGEEEAAAGASSQWSLSVLR